MISTLVKDVSVLVGLSEDELLRESMAAYLREKKRSLMAEKFEILSRYQATSAEEIKKRIEEGEIHDHPAWEDYIELTNLIEELQIRSFPKHFHDGTEDNVRASDISDQPDEALREFLVFVRTRL